MQSHCCSWGYHSLMGWSFNEMQTIYNFIFNIHVHYEIYKSIHIQKYIFTSSAHNMQLL
jgi:hypothetical protein